MRASATSEVTIAGRACPSWSAVWRMEKPGLVEPGRDGLAEGGVGVGDDECERVPPATGVSVISSTVRGVLLHAVAVHPLAGQGAMPAPMG